MPKRFKQVLHDNISAPAVGTEIELIRMFIGTAEIMVEVKTDSTSYDMTFEVKGPSGDWYPIAVYEIATAALQPTYTNAVSSIYSVTPVGADFFRLNVGSLGNGTLTAEAVVTV
jgi:hypothetical protein